MPSATSRTSAPTASHTFAIALMNEIFVARYAFDACLIISADAASVTTIGAGTPRYSSETRTATVASSQPMTMRCGWRKSRTAVPSRRNSGFDATRASCDTPDSASQRATRRVVPTGTVLLLTTTASGCRSGAISRATASIAARSAPPSSPWGVPTHRKTKSASRTAAAAPTTNCSRWIDRPSATRPGRPSSRIGISPLVRRATRSASMSAQRTSCPSRAKHAAVVSPTYPAPMTATSLTVRVLPHLHRMSVGGAFGVVDHALAVAEAVLPAEKRVSSGPALPSLRRSAHEPGVQPAELGLARHLEAEAPVEHDVLGLLGLEERDLALGIHRVAQEAHHL